MNPHFAAAGVTLWHGDCIEVMAAMPDASVDAVVTDPPYGIGFMGHQWDQPGVHGPVRAQGRPAPFLARNGRGSAATEAGRYDQSKAAHHVFQAWCEAWATECYRLLKPGGHLLAFGGTRTAHRLAAGVEDAGFEIRDSIAWLFGSGFPKSLDVSKAIDKAAGATRDVVGPGRWNNVKGQNGRAGGITRDGYVSHGGTQYDKTAPATEDAARWLGWGTALKPSFEPVVVARKPLVGTVAANVLTHGTGALNVDACRIEMSDADRVAARVPQGQWTHSGTTGATEARSGQTFEPDAGGRWPANVVLDESQAAELDRMAPNAGGAARATGPARTGESASVARGMFAGTAGEAPFYDDRGGASRFFYTPKAAGSERPRVDGIAHPTVKPVDLMRWLVRLVTPRGGLVLEPFAGSGTTIEAAVLEGFACTAIEREADYLPLIMQRVSKPHAVGLDFDWEAS